MTDRRLKLYDINWGCIWDSTTATTPAYPLIPTWGHAAVERDRSGWKTRQLGRMYRCPEGIKWEPYPSQEWLRKLVTWPNPILETLSCPSSSTAAPAASNANTPASGSTS